MHTPAASNTTNLVKTHRDAWVHNLWHLKNENREALRAAPAELAVALMPATFPELVPPPASSLGMPSDVPAEMDAVQMMVSVASFYGSPSDASVFKSEASTADYVDDLYDHEKRIVAHLSEREDKVQAKVHKREMGWV